ncbi:MAG: Gfo/Idh/MocA family oxidoreductase [Bacteroidia bacterium]|nr:Gfo/Idh/MocA family oxidoreductase [Bacteroidia bacterium]
MLYNVKAGIIGLDELGRQYANLLKYHVKELNLIGGSGRTQKELLFAKNELSLEYVYPDYHQLIENHDIDAIFVFCPPDQKSFVTSKAIEAGKHVFIDTPIATNVEDAEFLIKTAESHPSQISMAGFPFRLNSSLNRVKEFIELGKIGLIKSITTDSAFTHGISSRYVQPSGSFFIDYSLNEIDLILWLTGENIKWIQTNMVHSDAHVRMLTESGALCDLTVFGHNERQDSSLVIRGTDGIIKLDNYNPFVLDYSSGQDKLSKRIFVADDIEMDNDYLHLKHFVDVIMGRASNTLKLRSNSKALEYAIAMEKSKVLNQAVSFEEKH